MLNKVYLNLGSNIEPEKNMRQAIQLLKERTNVQAVSAVWETESVGYEGANFLNMSAVLYTEFDAEALKEQVLRPIEIQLGRVRDGNKNSPRTMDIDIVLFNETIHNMETWKYAFIFVPLAELIPTFVHPFENKDLSQVVKQNQVWILKREGVIS
jgi:2-amino-4-hydroxy-6-hydroxymethyldihydropteridine diphosphokinase